MNNALSLRDHYAKRSLSLREQALETAQRAQSNILLIDTSGSMREEIQPHESKIDILWTIVQSLRTQSVFALCEFNSAARWSDGIAKPTAEGGTALAEALHFVASAKPLQVTIITDGYPNDPQDALATASELHCKINVLYIGKADDERAQAFCRALAQSAGGSYSANELCSEALALSATQSIAGYLQPPAVTKPTIQL